MIDNTGKNILVAVDFREQSYKVLNRTIDLARFIKANITLLHVINTNQTLLKLLNIKNDDLAKAEKEARDKLAELAASLAKGNDDIQFTPRIEIGKAHEKILAVAEQIDARFIIIGKNDVKVGKKHILGSTLTHIVSEAKSPVISLPGNCDYLGYKCIVVPLDLTKQTRLQVFNAISFGLYYNARINLVSVLVGGIKARRSRIFAKLKKAQKTIIENGLECSIDLFGRSKMQPYEIIIDYAHKKEADLIMLMTHQETYANDNYIGAFAHHIINESDIPVLSLTSAAAEFDDEILMDTVVDPFGVLDANPEKKLFGLFKGKLY